MDSDMDEELMVDTAEAKHKNLTAKRSWCRRYGVPVALVAITIGSCLMSIITAIVYYTKVEPDHRVYKQQPPTFPPVSASRLLGNHSVDQEFPAYAHKILDMNFSDMHTPDSKSSTRGHYLHIDPTGDNGAYEVSVGVTLQPHGIRIVHPGTYFVYKSVFFRHRSSLECNVLDKKAFESLLKLNSTLNSEGITTLLSTFHSCCPTCQDTEETAFSGGVFYFKAGDVIQVEVLGKDSIDVEKDVSYFGLMKLGTLQ